MSGLNDTQVKMSGRSIRLLSQQTNKLKVHLFSAACSPEERRNGVASELDGRSYSMPQAKQCDGVASELDGRSFPVALQSQVTCRNSTIDMYIDAHYVARELDGL